MKELKNHVSLIVGGNGDIGGAIAKGLCSLGADVIPLGRNKSRNKSTIASLKKLGNSWSENISIDVNQPSTIKQVLRSIIKKYKKIDSCVCAAGIYMNKSAETLTLSEWNNIINTNLTGSFNVCRIVGEKMLLQGSGSIVNISSLSAVQALTGTIAYSVSKAGVISLTQGLSAEWASRGVRVNAIIPGVFPTKLNKKALQLPGRKENILKGIPIRRLGDVKELIGATRFLVSKDSTYVTGIALPVDGGFLSFSGY